MLSIMDRRRMLVGGTALAAAAGAVAASPRREAVSAPATSLSNLIPAHVGDRRALEDPGVIPERVDAAPSSGETISRRYEGAIGPDIMLIVSYHGARSPDLKVHRPETCYKVAGFVVEPVQPTNVPLDRGVSLPAVFFSSQRGPRRESVLYWTRVGGAFPQSLLAQRTDFIAQALMGLRADGLLVRMSVLGDDFMRHPALLRGFARDLLRATTLDSRRLLLGPLSSAI